MLIIELRPDDILDAAPGERPEELILHVGPHRFAVDAERAIWFCAAIGAAAYRRREMNEGQALPQHDVTFDDVTLVSMPVPEIIQNSIYG